MLKDGNWLPKKKKEVYQQEVESQLQKVLHWQPENYSEFKII